MLISWSNSDQSKNFQLSQNYDSDSHHFFPENVEENDIPLYTIFTSKTFKNLDFYQMKKPQKIERILIIREWHLNCFIYEKSQEQGICQ